VSDAAVRADVGVAFVAALAAKDRASLTALLHPQIEFRGLTPGGSWEASTSADVAEILLGS
jgi:hypothetical protein